MEDHKRLILPAIAAIILHGFLISFNVSKHGTSKPAGMGNPVRVEINAFSPQPPAPEKVADDRKVDVISPAPARQNIERQEVPVQAVPLRPKRMAKPDAPHKAAAPLQEQPKKQETEQTGSLPGTTFAKPDTSSSGIQETLPEARNPIVPKQQTAMPVYQRNQQPSYPVMAKQRGHQGQILLHVLVTTEGTVSELTIKQSSGHASLDAAALAAVKNWLFTPATEDGRPVSIWVDVPVEFRLKSNGAI
jgi:periplasmic protein TonB